MLYLCGVKGLRSCTPNLPTESTLARVTQSFRFSAVRLPFWSVTFSHILWGLGTKTEALLNNCPAPLFERSIIICVIYLSYLFSFYYSLFCTEFLTYWIVKRQRAPACEGRGFLITVGRTCRAVRAVGFVCVVVSLYSFPLCRGCSSRQRWRSST